MIIRFENRSSTIIEDTRSSNLERRKKRRTEERTATKCSEAEVRIAHIEVQRCIDARAPSRSRIRGEPSNFDEEFNSAKDGVVEFYSTYLIILKFHR